MVVCAHKAGNPNLFQARQLTSKSPRASRVHLVINPRPVESSSPIEGTPYSYRVQGYQDNLPFGSSVMSVAIVEFKSPQKMFTRWVFDDPKHNRDLAE